MKLPTSPTTDAEWALQERAREEERTGAAAGPGARLNRYRLISRLLSEPLPETLPQDFAVAAPASIERHSAVFPRQRAMLVTIGVAYAVAMATAAFLMRTDIGRAIAMLDWPIGLLATLAALSLAAPRVAGLIRLLSFLPVTR